MQRRSRNIVLALIGSAGLMTCCLSSCVDARDEMERDKDGKVVHDARGQVVHHRRYFYSPWFGHSWWSPGYSYYSRPMGGTVTRSGGGTTGTGGSRPSGTATSRGGFGGTGHATAGG